MKKFLLGSLMIIISLSLLGCDKNTKLTFVEPEPSDWVEYMKPLREYMYYRTQSVLNNDINILWDKYEGLKDNIDRKVGINAEKYEVESLNENQKFIDANYNIESYDKIKVNKSNDKEVAVLVRGSITYLGNDFDESGGEYLIKVFLMHKDNEWTVVKTDEYTLSEYKEWIKENK
jgi:hypothetical protein